MSMTTDGVLRTVQSLLDNQPYKHEPGQKDHPEYSEFVRYTTWRWLLLDYLEKETHPGAKAWLQKYVVKKADKMMDELLRQQALPGPASSSTTRKTVSCRPYNAKEVVVDYPLLIQQLQNAILASKAAQPPGVSVPDTLDGTSGILPGGPSKLGTQVKRKTTADGEVHTSQTRTQAKALAGQQAEDSTTEKCARSSKRSKKTVEVIDLT